MLPEEQPLALDVVRLEHELTKRNRTRRMLDDHFGDVLHGSDALHSQAQIDVLGHPASEPFVEAASAIQDGLPVRNVGTATRPGCRDRRMEVQAVEVADHDRTVESRGLRRDIRRAHQRLQPASGRNRVVVGEGDQRATGGEHSPVPGGRGTPAAAVDVANAWIVGHVLERPVVVVDHHDLVGSLGVLVYERVEAAAQELGSPTGRDDDTEHHVRFGDLARIGQAAEDIGALRY